MALENNEYVSKLIDIKDTRFIFKTNFRGELDPNSRYPSTDRVANVVIPPSMVAGLEEAGVNVKATKPREGEEEGFQPTYYVKVKAAYRDKFGELKDKKRQPSIKLYRALNQPPVELDEESVGVIDEIDIKNISVRLNPWERPNGGVTLFIRNLSVLQVLDDDPFASMYGEPAPVVDDEEKEMPF